VYDFRRARDPVAEEVCMSDVTPILNQVDLVVRDVDASLAFYRLLGLDAPDAWRTASGAHHVDMDMPGGLVLHLDSVALARSYDAGWREKSGGAVIGFSVASRDAVDERYAALVAAGYTGSQPPYDTFWGARYAVVEDPDGNHVGIMSPLDPARRGMPPSLDGVAANGFRKAVPSLPVKDCVAALRFYCDVLGFRKDYDDSILRVEKTLFAGVSRGDCALTLNQHDRQSYRATVGIEVDDVDSLHRDYAARGVAILLAPQDEPWGERHMAVADLDGNELHFSSRK
jgi:uncharacterized glyoxalase superfamily protein PhnB